MKHKTDIGTRKLLMFVFCACVSSFLAHDSLMNMLNSTKRPVSSLIFNFIT